MSLAALLLAAGLTGTVGDTTSMEAPPPLVNVCWHYGCDRNQRVIVSNAAWQHIRNLLRVPAPDAAREREQVAEAIALFEAAVGRRTGTSADRHGNRIGAGLPGQQDCIDESRNTTGYLHALADRGLLRWHRVGERRQRAKWIFDQHWTAVLIERGNDHKWSVDSWYLDNGKQPYVQRLDAWYDKADLPPNPDAPDS